MERRDSGTIRLGDILIAKATCLEKLHQREESLAVLRNLLETRGIRAQHKAEALLQSGRLLNADGEAIQAIVYFERVYVSYGKFLPLVAQAYFLRGKALETLKKPEAAYEVYAEFAAREDLRAFPEYAQAAQRLKNLRGLEINNHPISGSGNIVRNHFSNPAIRLIWGANSFIAFFVSRTPVW